MLWGAIVIATLLELGVVLWADFDRHVEPVPPLVIAFIVLAASAAGASLTVPARLHADALRRLTLPVQEVPAAGPAEVSYRTAAGSQRVFRDGDAARAAMTQAFLTPLIVGLALAELVALLGLVLAQARFAPSWWALPFFGAAWALLGARFPRAALLEGPAERLYGATLPR